MKDVYDKESDKKIASQKIKNMFGGRLQSIMCSSAPIAANILIFFK